VRAPKTPLVDEYPDEEKRAVAATQPCGAPLSTPHRRRIAITFPGRPVDDAQLPLPRDLARRPFRIVAFDPPPGQLGGVRI
jgi:hypothetical protein